VAYFNIYSVLSLLALTFRRYHILTNLQRIFSTRIKNCHFWFSAVIWEHFSKNRTIISVVDAKIWIYKNVWFLLGHPVYIVKLARLVRLSTLVIECCRSLDSLLLCCSCYELRPAKHWVRLWPRTGRGQGRKLRWYHWGKRVSWLIYGCFTPSSGRPSTFWTREVSPLVLWF